MRRFVAFAVIVVALGAFAPPATAADNARFRGSVPGMVLCGSVTGIQLAPTGTGQGYYVLSDRGGVYAFGDAPDHGGPESLGIRARDIAVVR